jgi:hypothetical protein
MVISLTAFLIFTFFKFVNWISRRQFSKTPIEAHEWNPSSYSDQTSQQAHNLQSPNNETTYSGASSRDPMVVLPVAGSSDDDDDVESSSMFLGPPQDEDGNELHSVSII